MLSVSEQPSTTLTIDDVIVAVEQYHPKADFDLIRRAYAFGAEAHKEQNVVLVSPIFPILSQWPISSLS